MTIIVSLDVMLAKRKTNLTEFSERIDVKMTNISMLKNGKVKSIKFLMLDKICEALECQPGDILEYQKNKAVNEGGSAS
ncbi:MULTISPECIES: helix-turn-helix domain-containing protein [Bacillus cereus group]|uniref:Transcriptional regulator n=1 Tax=Bacillus thuringiensis TaxID=1428 RepID=A0A9X7AMX5_BACTU|nr:helix-turn-helix transcriptional regulator [Bacillus thuringiensis]MCQ6335084.1 helix-turn-helix transcriptional regulator [Bacillus cereus]PFT45880.1 transcriptional regulator [Bacillus thuringiensis]